MFSVYARNSHSYTHLTMALGIVREPTVWVFITLEYPGIHDIGLPSIMLSGFPGRPNFGNGLVSRRPLHSRPCQRYPAKARPNIKELGQATSNLPKTLGLSYLTGNESRQHRERRGFCVAGATRTHGHQCSVVLLSPCPPCAQNSRVNCVPEHVSA